MNFRGYKNAGLKVFDVSRSMSISFETYKYSLIYLNKFSDLLYHQTLTEEQKFNRYPISARGSSSKSILKTPVRGRPRSL
jgi:hypothetical protein